MKLALFDKTVPAPSPVIGWFDTDVFTYPNLPENDTLLELTEEEWEKRLDGHWAVDDGKLVAMIFATKTYPWMVDKLIVIERLGALGKLRIVREALKMEAADSTLTDDELLLRDRWNAAQMIASDDAQIRGFLHAVDIDADDILAKESSK